MTAAELGVWLGDLHVGTIRRRRRGGISFGYTAAAHDRWAGNTPVVSCSLPLRTKSQDADAFFDGVLPEAPYRDRLAAQAGVPSADSFALLDRYGRDIAGALVVSSARPEAQPGDVEELTRDALEAEVAELAQGERPLGIHDDSELSIAGIQDKMLLVDLGNDRWGRPRHGRPSTHILKLDHRVYRGLVAAEHDCLAVARAAGLDAANATILRIGDVDCLIVERFDRVRHTDGSVDRIHQEDSCQALGRAPTTKYEIRHGGGGPELSEVAELLERHADDPAREKTRLIEAVTYTVLTGNADAHGKNVSFLHHEPGHIELAPMYDTVPTAMWPKLKDESAMTVAGLINLSKVTPDDVAAEANRWRHGRDRARRTAIETAERVNAAAQHGTIDPEGSVARHLVARTTAFLRTA